MSVKTGNGATLAFGTSGFTPLVLSIDGLDETLAALDDSTLATTNYRTMCPGDLIEMAPFTVAIRWEQDDLPPLNVVAETITLTYALESGESSGATLIATGFLTGRTGPSLANDEIAEASIAIQFDGKTEPAYTPGT